MKLNDKSVESLESLVQTALVGGINTLIIDKNVDGDNVIRGIDEKQSVIIITKNNVPYLNDKQVAISRLSMLASRISLVKNQGGVAIEATEAKNGNDISHLEISSGKTKVQFRCSAVDVTRGVPKSMNDIPAWKIVSPIKIVSLLTQAAAAMQSEKVTISSKNLDSVALECIDTNNDSFLTEIEQKPEWLLDGDNQTTFAHSYPVKSLLPLFKEIGKNSDKFEFYIGEKGILSLNVNGFDFFVLPIA